VYYLISLSYIVLLKVFFYFSLLFSPLFLHLDIHPICIFFCWYSFCFALVGNSRYFWQASFISLIILAHSSYQSLFQLISVLKDRFKRYILLVHALKAYRGIRGIAALIVNLSTGLRCMDNFTSCCFTPARNTATHWIRRLNRPQSQCLLYFMMAWFFLA
jgi:heme exporter protein D